MLAAYSLLGATACGATPARPAAGTITASAAVSGPASSACDATVASTLGGIAGRIYHEAGTGGDVAQAVQRVQGSAALARAIGNGEAGSTAAALGSLLVGQIARIEVLRGGHVFASAGSGPAIAPVRGAIPGTDASYVLSVQPDRTFLQVASQVTGAQVLLLAGDRRLAGTIVAPASSIPASGTLTLGGREYEVYSLPGQVYPSGPMRIALLTGTAGLSCPSSIAQTHTNVLGAVGERIYAEELASPTVTATVRRMEATPAFREAVAARDPAATRDAIIGFFQAHLHVVRVRVSVGGRLLVDVGGPYALAPVAGTLHSGGHVIGNFLMAIQDDAGYLKLAHLFTGAQVLMRVGSRQVMGTITPGPASVPGRGTISYAGHTYSAYSFTGTAFPSGPLRISLLFGG